MKKKHIKISLIVISTILFLFVASMIAEKINTVHTVESTKNLREKNKISRIVITGNCPFSIGMANKDVYSKIVGTGPWTFSKNVNNELGNYTLLKQIKPDIDRIDNSFMNKSYKVNTESLQKLNPQKIFYYGSIQNDHLERFNVPIINLDRTRNGAIDPSVEQDYWETTYEKELSLPITHKFKNAWDNAKKQMDKVRGNSSIVGKRGLYIYMINNKVLRVSGNGSYGDAYLKMAGLKNVASDTPFFGNKAQQIDVSVEQILKWDPEVIIVCFGSASKLENETILNKTKAFQNHAIISTPVGIHNWGGAGGESSLLPLYISNKLDKKSVSDKDMEQTTKKYYKDIYNYNIPNNMLKNILKSR